MKKWKTLSVLILIVTILATVTACNPFGGSPAANNTQPVQVTRGNLIVTVNGDGNVQTSREVSLNFSGAGKLEKLNVKKGSAVKKGDILAKLDTTTLELAKSQAQIALSQAQTGVTQAKLAQQAAEITLTKTKESKSVLELALLSAQVSRKIADVALGNAEETAPAPDLQAAIDKVTRAETYLQYALDSQEAAVDSTIWDRVILRAQSDLDTAQAELDRITGGVDIDDVAIKKMQLEYADKAVTQAQKNIDNLNNDIALQENQVASAKQAVEQSQRSVELAQLSIDQAQKQLNDATLTAPFDAIVTSAGAEEQEIVSTLTTIATLADQNLELIINIDEIDVAGVKVNQEAAIVFDALPDTTIKGTVAAVYPAPKTVGGVVQYEVKINFPYNQYPVVKIGMSATADITTNQRNAVLLIPSRAIDQDAKGNATVDLMVNGQTQKRAVVTGVSDGLNTEIVSGLAEGETVVFTIRSSSSSAGSFFSQ